MIKVCGIELKASETRLVVIEGDPDNYEIVPLDHDKIKLDDSKSQESVQRYREQIIDFISYHDFHAIGIKERMSKGRFAGGALSFKMEGLIQTSDYKIDIVHSASIKSKTKDLIIDFDQVKKYQQEALRLAVYLMNVHYK